MSAHQQDPRSVALASYLRERAASFSMSADVRDSASTAQAGMALLDAAAIAETLSRDDPLLRRLSEAGLFESMPQGKACFLETSEIRAAVQRPLVTGPQTGAEILHQLLIASRIP